MKAIVVVYAVEKGRGSEQGSGYNFCLALSRQPGIDVTIVTRRNNAELLRSDEDFSGTTIIGYDPPRRWTFWKRGGHNIIAYYYAWQIGVGRLVRRISRRVHVDVIHQYNFHTDWAPQFLWKSSPPVVWGPICHQPRLPREYFRHSRFHRRLADFARWTAKRAFWTLDPNIRKAASRTDVILYANRDHAPVFSERSNVRQQTFGGAESLSLRPALDRGRPPSPAFLHVGRCVEIKGAFIALDAFDEYIRDGGTGTLMLIGEGPQREALNSRIASFGGRVTLKDWMSQRELAHHYATADALLYPSLGNQDTVVAEGLAAALPIICLADSGSATMAGPAAVQVTPGEGSISHAFARSMLSLDAASDAAWRELHSRALDRSKAISWAQTAASIRIVYEELAAT